MNYNCALQGNKVVLYKKSGNVAYLPQSFEMKNFLGVVARIDEDNLISLCLYYQETNIWIELYKSNDFGKILINWRLWAKAYDLPMYILGRNKILSKICDDKAENILGRPNFSVKLNNINFCIKLRSYNPISSR